MAVMNLNFESQYLGNAHNVTVILPDKPREADARTYYESGRKYRVLWLLHGSFDDGSGWLRRTMVEVYAREKDLIVVMPSALNSNYVNWNEFGTGFRMGDYLTEELMPLVFNWLPASPKKEDNFIAGDSMGAAGALTYMLSASDKFAAAAMLSIAPRDPATIDWDHLDGRFANTVKNQGGKQDWMNSVENSWDRILERHRAGTLPRMMFADGEEDALIYPAYVHFKEMCEREQIPIEFFELPGYGHEWRFWDISLQKALEFFGITEKGFVAF